ARRACRGGRSGAPRAASARFSKNGWPRLPSIGLPSTGRLQMYDHIGLKVKNLDASARFYAAALAPLGCVRDGSGFGPPGAPALWLYEGAGTVAAGTHVAFKAATRAAVDRFYRDGLAAGGRDHGAPGLRKDYAPTYYAAFLIDPDGNNVEAVCMAKE